MLTRGIALGVAALVGAGFGGTAHAEEVTVPGCVTYAGPTPDLGIYVGDVTVPVLTDVAVCAFGSATVYADTDPVEESTSCANGPAVEVGGPGVWVEDFGLAVRYTADGTPAGGTLYQPPLVIGGQLPGVYTGPLWSIDC